MNMMRTAKSETWIQASFEARDEFQDAMQGRHYGESETLNAWLWFYEGWVRAQDHMYVTLANGEVGDPSET